MTKRSKRSGKRRKGMQARRRTPAGRFGTVVPQVPSAATLFRFELLDPSVEASGAAVTACPVSARDFGGGCYREEVVKTNGSEERLVSLDTQPCVECGTCAVVADTRWEHPRGGKGVEFREG